ncbi:tannase/feruloyl esterase family alpha/beta hydrolase [Variovorax sp. ZS18.2.2]|uniref:tannase/feruloyl esterase family alpha/beta hydrolase n=1 Tax=Variovorax sp. ZS18.2.2 TaxID=2971255 RepID=UPI0021515B84|nr:tannase/feruloyl esterase family alpha/beta hydrolase [Variovorax sp. ZS18.2.2]MCR6479376.1 tannase/feruloyl esterase family alpha/beta hydrolase [Variovorax sp. ZS18.2.2]
MRTPRPHSILSIIDVARRARRSFGPAIGISLVSLVLAACGGGGGGGGGAGFFPIVPNNPPANGGPPDNPPPPTVVPVVACADLAGKSLPASLISLPTGGATVTSATPVAATDAGNPNGDYCKVRGTIQPVDPASQSINFAVNLPEKWNQKTIHFGGGGFDGVLIDGTEQIRFGPRDKSAPLALGYATYGDDSGHQSSSITDGRFAANDEQLANYGGLSLKKTRDVAQALVLARYGVKPKKAYFLGTSTGGRDALGYIQRWPLDYDGVIANEPALNYTGTRLSNVAVGRALYRNGGAGWLNKKKTLLVQDMVKQKCDKLDGAVDNIVSNVESCRLLNAQILSDLLCPGGTDTGDTCLSTAQIDTVKAIESPLEFSTYALANGVKRAGGYNLLEGTLVAGPYTTRDLGTDNQPDNPAGTDDANMYVTGDQWVKFFVTRIPLFQTLDFDPLDPGTYRERVTEVSNLTDATNPDLSPFFGHGGKLILLHGLADEVISNNSTIDYYKQMIATMGQAMVDQNVRFYTVPGMGHGTGVFIPNWDSLAALEGWAESGLAPATGVAVDAVPATYGRTRPLCQYPSWPKYNGSGSLDAAVNYSCVTETANPLACPNLPATVTTYKGGNSFGEELSVRIDPATMAYTVTIDASVQRTAATTSSGTLVSQKLCSYTSDEAGAVFTFASGGVLQGGVKAPVGTSFAPLLAFQNTFENTLDPTEFKPVSDIFNTVGVQQDAGGAKVYAGAVRLRDAGTFQYCRSAADSTGSFMNYNASCTNTQKGYITYDGTHKAFNVFTFTAPVSGAPTSGGTLSGSMVIGMVGGAAVPLHLVRASPTDFGMRFYALQPDVGAELPVGAADGSYAMLSVSGQSSAATATGTNFNLAGAAATLTYNKPARAVIESSAGAPDHFIFNSGVIGYVSGAGTSAGLQFGVRH